MNKKNNEIVNKNQNKFVYDDCNYNVYLSTTTKPLEYSTYSGKYEVDPKNELNKNFNKNANIVNNFNSIGIRVDMESFLKNQELYSTKCPQNKNLPCSFVKKMNNSSKKLTEAEKTYGFGYCNKKPIVINPLLADRNLCPIN